MNYTQLDSQLRRLVEKNRKAYNKKMGFHRDRAKFDNNLSNKFAFDDSPEGWKFWWIVCYCENMSHLEIMPNYKEWQEKERKKLFYNITFILSLLMYGWLLYLFYLYLAPTKEIRNLLLFR